MTRTLSEIGSNIFPNLLSQEYFLARYPSKKSDIPARKKKKRVRKEGCGTKRGGKQEQGKKN